MIALTLAEVARATGGRLTGRDRQFVGISTDTRKLVPNELFLALRGPRFDGHDMVRAALKAGAAAVVVEQDVSVDGARIVVANTRKALGDLARYWRRKFNPRVLGITGSAGKTTVKEMLGAIMRRCAPTLVTAGNLNNDIGVPLTLFALDATHRFAVIEMGANRRGDIATLAQIAEPDVGVITLCAPSHLEGFGDIDTVARTKGELVAGLARDGTAILNQNDVYLPLWCELAAPRAVLTFGDDGDVRAQTIEQTDDGSRFVLHAPDGEIDVMLAYRGRHNVTNALAATAAALSAGADLTDCQAGLAAARPVAGRLQERRGIAGSTVIDDSYNANPASVAAALDVLAGCGGRRWFVFGDMGELGQQADTMHEVVGRAARAAGVDRMFALGDLSVGAVREFGAGGEHFSDHESLLAAVRTALNECTGAVTLLIKGSRFMALDRVVDALTAGEPTPC